MSSPVSRRVQRPPGSDHPAQRTGPSAGQLPDLCSDHRVPQARVGAHTHTRTRTHTRTHTHARAHTHTHTHTEVRLLVKEEKVTLTLSFL